jgi:uncharacterized protein YkwD
VDLRIKLLIALAGLGVVVFALSRPEVRRSFESRLAGGNAADAGAGSAPVQPSAGQPVEVVVLPGSHLSFELMAAPQTHYLAELEEDAGDVEFQEMVKSLGDSEVAYDPWLSRAAREIAYQGAVFGDSPPEAALSFILRSSGSPELSVAQVLVRASGDDPKIIRDAVSSAIENATAGGTQLLVGIGEAATEDDTYDRRVVVVVARRHFSLESTRRSVALDEQWLIRGRAAESMSDAHASVLYPDFRVVDIPFDVKDGEFSLSVPTGSAAGTLRVSIDGVGASGPFKLLQLEAEIDSDPPREFDMLVPELEEFRNLAEAEGHALMLLNRDRHALELPPLLLDEALSDIARNHSQEMRDKDYFAHLSETTGLAGDRLERARYRASSHGENLALNDSVYEAQASLLESVGHRRNIINTSMTHVGIGLAKGTGKSGNVSWYLTQLFARKVVPFDNAKATEEFFGRINAARREAGPPPLVRDSRFFELAEEGCRRALASPLEDVPDWLGKKASKLSRTTIAVSLHVFYDFDSLEPDATSLRENAKRIGIAFLRDEDNLHGRTLLAIITAE